MFTTSAIVLLLLAACHAQPTRIVGGKDIDITEAPWQISLQRISDFHKCGGSIISDRWILTAAHCLTDVTIDNRKIVVGMTERSEGGIEHTIKRIISHPQFGNESKYNNDIGLIELNKPIAFNERAQPVKLPLDHQVLPVGRVCNIQGWGTLSNDGPTPDHLQGTTLPLWEPADCEKAWDEPFFVGPKATMICAGWEGSHPDTCSGDSGGPLTYNGIQYGIVSFGAGCANPDYPKVFTHVYNFRDFIYKHTGL